MKPPIDITGARYGKLLVQKRSKAAKFWVCLCDCGSVCDVRQTNLRVGNTRSCGCLVKETKASKASRPWTPAELDRLSSDDTERTLSRELGRPMSYILKKRRELGLVKNQRKRLSTRPEAKHPPLGSTA